jgi:hypothetical protein
MTGDPKRSAALEKVRQLLYPNLPPEEGRARINEAISDSVDPERWRRIEQIAAQEPDLVAELIEALRHSNGPASDEGE